MFNPSLINPKYKQCQRKSKRYSGLSYRFVLPLNIYFCLSLTNFYLSMRHIDLITWYLKWKLKKSGVLVFPTAAIYPITKKPTEIWMGKGKGGVTDWAIPTKIGSMPFMLQGVKNKLVKTKLSDVLKKLPICSKIVESKHNFWQANKITTYFISDRLTKYLAIEKKILD